MAITVANPSSTTPPLKLERDLQAEQRNLQRFVAENPGVDIQNNPEARARAETFINAQTYGTSKPVFASQFNIPQLQEQVAQRDPFAFLSNVARETEAQRPTQQALAGIEQRLSKIEDPRVRERIRSSVLGTRGQATQALLSRAENLYGQQTEGLQNQLATQLGLFDVARQQASQADQERLQIEAENRDFERQKALLQLQALLSGRGGGGGGRSGGGGGDLPDIVLGEDGEDGGEAVTDEERMIDGRQPGEPGALRRGYNFLRDIENALNIPKVPGTNFQRNLLKNIIDTGREGISDLGGLLEGGPTPTPRSLLSTEGQRRLAQLSRQDQELLDLAESNL